MNDSPITGLTPSRGRILIRDAVHKVNELGEERRAEVLAEAEASADAWEDRIDELLEDAGLNVVDGVIQVDNVVESPRPD